MKSVRLIALLMFGAALGASAYAIVDRATRPIAPQPPRLEVLGGSIHSIQAAWEGVNLDGFNFAFHGPHQIEIRFTPDDFELNVWPPEAGRRGVVLFDSWCGRDYALKIRPLAGDFQIQFPHDVGSVTSWAEVYELDLGWLPRLPDLLELLVVHREKLLVEAGSAAPIAPLKIIALESL